MLILNDIVKRSGEVLYNAWTVIKVESEETKLSVYIIIKIIKGEEVSENEKKFLKFHSKDIARILPLIIISSIPIPIPIIPLLIIIGKKYGFNFIPRDNRYLLNK